MRDFFDEDFPLSEKQEAEQKALEAQKKLAEEQNEEAEEDAFEEAERVELFFDGEDEEEIPAYDRFEEIEDSLAEAILGEVEKLTPIDKLPEIIDKEPAEESAEEYAEEADEATYSEPVEYDPVEHSPILEFDNEPLDDGFLPDAPIIVLDNEEEYEEIPEDELDRELRELNEKLDSMERAVSELTPVEDTPVYEFDERYFAEEETTAYKHPELVKKAAPKKAKTSKAGISISAKKDNVNVDINLKTLAKVGAAVAGIAIAAKLLSSDKKK